jgi:hypothetical protein
MRPSPVAVAPPPSVMSPLRPRLLLLPRAVVVHNDAFVCFVSDDRPTSWSRLPPTSSMRPSCFTALPSLRSSRSPRFARTVCSWRRGGARHRWVDSGAGGPGGRRQAAPWAGAVVGIHPILVSGGPPPWQGHQGAKEGEWGRVGVKPRLGGALQMGAVIMGGRAGHGEGTVSRGKGASATGDG